MDKDQKDFPLEYCFIPTPDAEARLAQALDIIVALILEDVLNDKGEEC